MFTRSSGTTDEEELVSFSPAMVTDDSYIALSGTGLESNAACVCWIYSPTISHGRGYFRSSASDSKYRLWITHTVDG